MRYHWSCIYRTFIGQTLIRNKQFILCELHISISGTRLEVDKCHNTDLSLCWPKLNLLSSHEINMGLEQDRLLINCMCN